jgi:hypothetical protein
LTTGAAVTGSAAVEVGACVAPTFKTAIRQPVTRPIGRISPCHPAWKSVRTTCPNRAGRVTEIAPRVSPSRAAQQRARTSEAFCPPNPKLFEIAILRGFSRAVFGT